MVRAMPPPAFAAGDRVRIGPRAPWANGETGTVNPDDWPEALSAPVVRRRSGPARTHYVALDAPHDDGSGDGPYHGGDFAEDELEPLA